MKRAKERREKMKRRDAMSRVFSLFLSLSTGCCVVRSLAASIQCQGQTIRFSDTCACPTHTIRLLLLPTTSFLSSIPSIYFFFLFFFFFNLSIFFLRPSSFSIDFSTNFNSFSFAAHLIQNLTSSSNSFFFL